MMSERFCCCHSLLYGQTDTYHMTAPPPHDSFWLVHYTANKKYVFIRKNMLDYLLWIFHNKNFVCNIFCKTLAHHQHCSLTRAGGDIIVASSRIDMFNVIYHWHMLNLLFCLPQLYVHSSPYTPVITTSMGNFEISSLHCNRDESSTSAMRCQHLTVSDEDGMSALISIISLMLGSSILHIIVCSQLRQAEQK